MDVKLRELREARHIKVSQMIERLGVKDSRYRKWESGSAQIPLEFACACADILHCSLDELAGRKTPNRADVLSVEESRLITAYKIASDDTRDILDDIANRTIHRAEENAIKKASTA